MKTKNTFIYTILAVVTFMVSTAGNISAQSFYPTENKGYNLTTEQFADHFENGDHANAIFPSLETLRASGRDFCTRNFNANRELLLKNPKNQWMANGKFADDAVLWVLRHVHLEYVVFSKGQCIISRIAADGSCGEFMRPAHGDTLNGVFVDSVEIAAVYDNVIWYMHDCKNWVIDNRPNRLIFTPAPIRKPDADTVIVFNRKSSDDVLANAGGPNGATVYKGALKPDTVYRVVTPQPSGAGNVYVTVPVTNINNINAGNNSANNTNTNTATAKVMDTVITVVASGTTSVADPSKGIGLNTAYNGTSTPMYCTTTYQCYDYTCNGKTQKVYRKGDLWLAAGTGAFVGFAAARLIDLAYNNGGNYTIVNNNSATANSSSTSSGGYNPRPRPSTSGGPFDPSGGGGPFDPNGGHH